MEARESKDSRAFSMRGWGWRKIPARSARFDVARDHVSTPVFAVKSGAKLKGSVFALRLHGAWVSAHIVDRFDFAFWLLSHEARGRKEPEPRETCRNQCCTGG